jgi:5'-methylthioadenosine phosphorylase
MAVDRIGDDFASPAHSALATAIITDHARISAEVKERLALIAGKYLEA